MHTLSLPPRATRTPQPPRTTHATPKRTPIPRLPSFFPARYPRPSFEATGCRRTAPGPGRCPAPGCVWGQRRMRVGLHMGWSGLQVRLPHRDCHDRPHRDCVGVCSVEGLQGRESAARSASLRMVAQSLAHTMSWGVKPADCAMLAQRWRVAAVSSPARRAASADTKLATRLWKSWSWKRGESADDSRRLKMSRGSVVSAAVVFMQVMICASVRVLRRVLGPGLQLRICETRRRVEGLHTTSTRPKINLYHLMNFRSTSRRDVGADVASRAGGGGRGGRLDSRRIERGQ